MHFRDRTWPAIAGAFTAARGRPMPPPDTTISPKRDDALSLAARLAGPLTPPATAPPPATIFLRALAGGLGGGKGPA